MSNTAVLLFIWLDVNWDSYRRRKSADHHGNLSQLFVGIVKILPVGGWSFQSLSRLCGWQLIASVPTFQRVGWWGCWLSTTIREASFPLTHLTRLGFFIHHLLCKLLLLARRFGYWTIRYFALGNYLVEVPLLIMRGCGFAACWITTVT